MPVPPSWFPGHMMKFTRMLPALLKKTNVVLEIRDSRLPLTSINASLEGAVKKWRLERGWNPHAPSNDIPMVEACEHIVVLNKRDLVPEWGLEPFRKAMANKFPDQRVVFASWQRPRDIRNLTEILVQTAKKFPLATEMNVLVVGMPNVGKSTLLNAIRNMGIQGPTPKAFKTSANPGMTQALSTRLKVSLDPLVYAYDSPGVMLPFLGLGEAGAERGIKLALIAGIKEGLYDMESLANYLLYRLNTLNPECPAYMGLLPAGSSPTSDLEQFLTLLAQRMGMVKRGGYVDLSRAADYFVRWWRGEGGLLAASTGQPLDARVETDSMTSASPPLTASQLPRAWGFDFQWSISENEFGAAVRDSALLVQRKMEETIDLHLEERERSEGSEENVSPTQRKKQMVLEEKEKRKQKQLRKRESR
ncbi:P-loop containing nucleoside triphosphate hydrolase protein [Panaeolus papilionaceus]|nr:P-loop containing nucleoside triphosphate hydrolase protein [Panaeolus papilionaceus]